MARFDGIMRRIHEVTNTRTQVQLAEVLDVRQSSISDAKRRCSIPAEWQLKLFRKFNAHPDWIMDGDKAEFRYATGSDEFCKPVDPAAIEARIRAELDNPEPSDLLDKLQELMPGQKVLVVPDGCEALIRPVEAKAPHLRAVHQD